MAIALCLSVMSACYAGILAITKIDYHECPLYEPAYHPWTYKE